MIEKYLITMLFFIMIQKVKDLVRQKKKLKRREVPILFGVIKNSNKLYYLSDWKDEYCDLTLEEMFKVLKGKVLEINNKSVKTFISKMKA